MPQTRPALRVLPPRPRRQHRGATTKVDKFGDRVTTLPDGTKIYIDAETGQATDDVNAIEKKVYGIKDKDVNVKYHADTREPDNYKPPVKYGTVIYQGAGGYGSAEAACITATGGNCLDKIRPLSALQP